MVHFAMGRTIYKFFLTLTLLLFVQLVSGENKTFTLVLDAGHGGHDAGAIGTYSKEKNINLNITLKVAQLIQRNMPDVKIVFTRKTDVFIPLHERAAIANRNKADLFISIHTNSLEGGKLAYGSETYSLGMARSKENLEIAKRENSVILYENDYQKSYAGFNPKSSESYIIFEFMQDKYMRQSVELAKAIQTEYHNVGRADKGVKQAGFLVLRETTMPSVLTELGFISTPQEEQYLNSQKGTDELATAIYRGFAAYKQSVQRSKSVVLDNAGRKSDAPIGTQFSEVMKAEVKAGRDARERDIKNSNAKDGNQSIPERRVVSTKSGGQKENLSDTGSATTAPSDKRDVKSPLSSANSHATLINMGNSNERNNAKTKPCFKIQILTAPRMLRNDSQHFKGLDKVDYYKDGNIYKYTYGSTTDYNEIVRLKRSIVEKFPDCFIIAMQGDQRISIAEARAALKKK